MTKIEHRLEAIKHVHDWVKWLVLIETTVIAIIGAAVATGLPNLSVGARILGTIAIVTFTTSIAAATMLSLTLPDIIQNIENSDDVWSTRDAV